MGQQDRAMSELESYITHLESQNKKELAVTFLEDLARDHEEQPLIKRTLAALLHRSGRMGEAIPILDQLGEALLEKGDKQGAMEVINQIVLMNPPNAQDYRALLAQMQNS
jgi:predicted Zn-dependent protease